VIEEEDIEVVIVHEDDGVMIIVAGVEVVGEVMDSVILPFLVGHGFKLI
jgi:hypothetical protein